jgi:hypothetical protein
LVGKTDSIKVTERLLSQIWEHQLIKKKALLTEDGQRLEIIYPGRPNHDSGPDFREAVVALEGRKLKGDVELHVAGKGWREHGHNTDPGYNGVILHVIMWDGNGTQTVLNNGKKVPSLALQPYLAGTLEELSQRLQNEMAVSEACCRAVEDFSDDSLARILDRAGEERFYSKAQRFAVELAFTDTDQVLYQGIMRALGYAKNKRPAETLARRLPLNALKKLALHRSAEDRVFALQAIFIGAAGLLPGQRFGNDRGVIDEFARELENFWSCLRIKRRISDHKWRFFRVRPENFPTRRLAAASCLLGGHREGGLFQTLSRPLYCGFSVGVHRELEEQLMVSSDGYWANHYDFGILSSRGNSRLIGRERARVIAVNILLPFFSAWAERNSQQQLRNRAVEVYRGYPSSVENWVTRHMERQLRIEPDAKLINTACRQQGLINIYRAFCTRRLCGQCPIGVEAG